MWILRVRCDEKPVLIARTSSPFSLSSLLTAVVLVGVVDVANDWETFDPAFHHGELLCGDTILLSFGSAGYMKWKYCKVRSVEQYVIWGKSGV